MKVSRSRLAAVIAERSLTTISAHKLAQEIAAYLLDEGRTSELDSILRDIMQYRSDEGIVEVMAVSAYDIDAQVRRDIEVQVRELYPHAKQILISGVHDASVIGGVRLELANQQLDLSIRAKLNRFKQLTTAPGGI
jgi:F0F1-type ATP synthase delta subunit